jgi:hypothetical protein
MIFTLQILGDSPPYFRSVWAQVGCVCNRQQLFLDCGAMQAQAHSTPQPRTPAQIEESMISPTVLPEHVERGVWGPPVSAVQRQANSSASQRTRFSVSDISDSDSSDTAKRTSSSDAEYDMCELDGIGLLSIDGVQRRGARMRRSLPMDGIAAGQRRSKAYDAGGSDSEIEVDDDWNYLCRGRKRRVSAGDAVGKDIAAVTSGTCTSYAANYLFEPTLRLMQAAVAAVHLYIFGL